jgi:hypothetical protein
MGQVGPSGHELETWHSTANTFVEDQRNKTKMNVKYKKKLVIRFISNTYKLYITHKQLQLDINKKMLDKTYNMSIIKNEQ